MEARNESCHHVVRTGLLRSIYACVGFVHSVCQQTLQAIVFVSDVPAEKSEARVSNSNPPVVFSEFEELERPTIRKILGAGLPLVIDSVFEISD